MKKFFFAAVFTLTRWGVYINWTLDVTAEAGSQVETLAGPARETQYVGAKIPAGRKANQIVRRLWNSPKYTTPQDQATFQA